jgi:hypothetical protein
LLTEFGKKQVQHPDSCERRDPAFTWKRVTADGRISEAATFLDTAYGSAREVEYQVSLAFRPDLLPEPAHRQLPALTVETSKVLSGLLRSLRKQ